MNKIRFGDEAPKKSQTRYLYMYVNSCCRALCCACLEKGEGMPAEVSVCFGDNTKLLRQPPTQSMGCMWDGLPREGVAEVHVVCFEV